MKLSQRSAVALDQFAETYQGQGVVIKCDSFGRSEPDNVMPILYEEQVVTWRLLGERMVRGILARRRKVSADFLDVGTGSGIWVVWVAKSLEHKGALSNTGRLVAIDKVPRMVRACEENLRLNLVPEGAVRVVQGEYSAESVAPHSVGAAFMNPPYHLYPEEVKATVPHHARGGSDGKQLFEEWLRIANQHLAKESSLYFHHMCLGDENGPAWRTFIPEHVKGVRRITAFNILEPMKTADFLKGVYGEAHADFQKQVSSRYPLLYFTSGAVDRWLGFSGEPEITLEPIAPGFLAGASWSDRVALHRELAHRERGG